MTRRALIALVASAMVGIPSIPAKACIAIRLIADDGGVVVGRTMEFGFDVQSDILMVPTGIELTSSLADYADPDPSKGTRALAPEDYGTWLLANFSSAEGVKANTRVGETGRRHSLGTIGARISRPSRSRFGRP